MKIHFVFKSNFSFGFSLLMELMMVSLVLVVVVSSLIVVVDTSKSAASVLGV
jgi:hypothetical protein